MGRKSSIDSKVSNPSSRSWSRLIGFITYVLPHLLNLLWNFFSNSLQMDTHLFFIQETSSQVLDKWVHIYIFCSRILFFNFLTNWYPHFFFQDFYDTTTCRSNSWTNLLHRINPSLKLHQELFIPNKSIISRPN
jgi:hypothetical protein